MEMELEPRVKTLSYKVKATSRESPSQKAAHVLETDLRSHWSTATNNKEWILLELDEPCLLSHIRVYNKSVLEWEIAVGLRYKPETFVKVRPRCEAPRRDVVYPMNYTPCRYVRISCLRGNPIAIFFVQLIGISVAGLEPEFQPVVSHLLPSIIAHKLDANDMHLQLLQDITSRLLLFLPHLEADLTCFQDSPEDSLRFLAMLAGPWYPILHIVNQREAARSTLNASDSEVPKHSQPSSSLTVSSNFEPRRSRSSSLIGSSTTGSLVFRPEFIFLLFRKASKESDLAKVCRMVSRVLHKFEQPIEGQNASTAAVEVTSASNGLQSSEFCGPSSLVDYSALLGEEFHIPGDQWDLSLLNVLDIASVEEGIFHVLFACASQSLLFHKLADSSSDFWSVLPLIQALLPALRPSVSSLGDHADNSFSQWKQPVVQQALSQIVATSCSPVYRSLLHACSGYLSSFSVSHAKAACILIDLCSSVLAPWVGQVIAKVDLAMELMEDLMGTILDARHSPARARAALKYIILALSGQMDDVLSKYKEVKHRILFLLEMLEPFLDPAIHALKKTISFGDVSLRFMEKQEQACAVALNVIRTAVRKPAVLPAIESEWRHRSVTPSVLLSVLEPHMQLPPEIDQCKCPASKDLDNNSSVRHLGTISGSNNQDELTGNTDFSDAGAKTDVSDDSNLLFAPPELQTIVLGNASRSPNEYNTESDPDSDTKNIAERSISHLFPNSLQVLDAKFSAEYFSLQADFVRLINYRDSEMKASEFKRLALDLHSQDDIAIETHNAAVDALLLAADCYVNPFFVMSSGLSSQIIDSGNVDKTASAKNYGFSDRSNDSERIARNLETVALVERDRDKVVLQLVLEAAELDRKFQCGMSEEQLPQYTDGDDGQVVRLSPLDLKTADAITLVRQNQSLLFDFLIQHLKNDQNLMHEILMHCLVFLLHTATRLYCAPEEVIDIILGSAEHLNRSLTSIYPQLKEGNFGLGPEKLYGMQRRWILLHKLVVASTGGEGSDFAISAENKFRCGNLIPQSAWMQRISTFSVNAFPLVRYLGWMAISRIAKLYTKERLFLGSDLKNLTSLLSIFVDELALVDNIGERKNQEETVQLSVLQRDRPMLNENEVSEKQGHDLSFHVMYPVLSKFLPNLKDQFQYFGESILEAVGLQLRSLSSGFLPDIFRWFSDLCSWPFFQDHQFSSPNKYSHVKGYAAKNAKAIILYILEAIVVEHMEAMVPEIPRVVHMLVVLCRSPFCDVPFLQSVMHLLKPIISYSLLKLPNEEKILVDDSCLNFESLCFEELFIDIRTKYDDRNLSLKDHQRASTIFILANVFTDLSFQRRKEILQSLFLWVDFTTFEPTTSFYDYLSAFHAVIDSCKVLLIQALESFGAVPLQSSNSSDLDRLSDRDYCPAANESISWFLNEVCSNSSPQFPKKLDCEDAASSRQKENLSADEIVDFFGVLENVIIKLHPTIESCWNLHPQLVKNLTVASAQCFVYSKCISSIGSYIQHAEDSMEDKNLLMKSADQFSSHWTIALGGLAEIIVKLQGAHCWEVASLLLDCLLAAPHCVQMDNVIVSICSSIKNFACSAPKIVWRLQVDKWLSILLTRGFHCIKDSGEPLTDLFITLLCHSEPEQRFLVLQQLGRLVSQDINCETVVQMSRFCNKVFSATSYLSVPKSFLSLLVSRTWDQVVLMASSDVIFSLRVPAMALLMGYIPYVARQQLQSFLAASDNILHALGKRTADGASEGPFLMLSLALIAVACLYSPTEDFSLIPQEVWRNIEIIASSGTGKFGDLEKNVCQALCKLQNEGDEGKQVLKKTLSSSSTKQADPEFGSTRESILQVLPNLTAVYSYFNMFSKKIDDEAMKLEEAEIELDILLKEDAKGELKGASGGRQNILHTDATINDRRLQQIKDQIQSLEKSKLQEEIVARRQKKLLLRRNRQKYLEEAAFREEELLRDLDRERMDQAEKDIERHRVLEIERAKTKELRHQLDIEKEKQTQRELQRELEQAESSSRSSRREFPSRPRDRYRERENGRAGTETAARSGSGNLQTEIPSTSSAMAVPVVLSSSRQFSGQPPTILQPRDRQDEFASSYEESLDFGKDSGDSGSVGDPESMSVFDGQSSGFGSAQRQGPRGGKSRQILERRVEREGRREGKWERKNG